MSSVHDQPAVAAHPAAVTMTTPKPALLAVVREELLESVNAVIQFSEILLAEVGDRDRDDFAADLRKIHASGKHLRDMAEEFLDPAAALGDAEEDSLAVLQKRVRHDMRNALNPILNYSEMWLEDAEEQFLQGFLPDLRQILEHGRHCMAVLDRLLTLRDEGPADLKADDDPVSVPAWKEGGERVPAVEPGRCLVVDDSATNRDILTRLLTRQGHTVDTAVNGQEALDKLRAAPCDIVLLDIMMPVLNGFQVLNHLKADERLRDIPVIMISALDQDEGVVRCIAMGAEDYLPRPFNPLLLKARIGACLEKKRFRDKERAYLEQIDRERRRADELLRVILPEGIIEELKATNEVKPRRHENVAVLFADIVGFTPYCDHHGPEEVLPHLQSLVEAWENSALAHGVEKIKTIGDAFMAASGLLREVEEPVLACVRCGLEMIAAAERLPVGWTLRVGIHVGQVVAGVIGRRQYLFDLWGDTVNTAARMESHGVRGAITLSQEAWQRVAHRARGEEREVEVKGKGRLRMVRFHEFI